MTDVNHTLLTNILLAAILIVLVWLLLASLCPRAEKPDRLYLYALIQHRAGMPDDPAWLVVWIDAQGEVRDTYLPDTECRERFIRWIESGE